MSDRSSVRPSSDSAVLSTVRPYVLRIPGIRPCAPKRNVIVGFIYLYAAGIGAWLLL